MAVVDATAKFLKIFQPGYAEKLEKVEASNCRFAYYTSADTALKVIRNGELWFRNSSAMNDFSEISYGLRLVQSTISGPDGQQFREAVEDIFKGTIVQVSERLNGWKGDWKFETYIACISEHDASEDRSGRLSMWRAYGDTALVINNTPLLAGTVQLGVFSVPVKYLSNGEYQTHLNGITNEVLRNRAYLLSLGQETLVGYIQHMLFHTAVATKHPGFSEEKEWRLFYRPNEQNSEVMKKRVEVLGGVPQVIYALPLKNDPQLGLHGAAIPSLLDLIIVGLTEHPYLSVQAFRHVLEQAKVENFRDKVVSSDIPLRTG